MTANITDIFRAGLVRRWHCNPDLAHTVDRIDGHGARVARIIIALNPQPALKLIDAALTHDDGESVTGDVSRTTKALHPVFSALLEKMEKAARISLWGYDATAELAPSECLWLKFADRLDAYMWAQHHAPHVLTSDDWPDARVWLLETAEALGVNIERVI